MEIWTYPDERYYYRWYDDPGTSHHPPRTDRQITETVVERLRVNPLTADCTLNVDVKRGVVILRGQVLSRRAKRAAGDDCWDTDGVADVSNQLEVDGLGGQGQREATVRDIASECAQVGE